MSVARCIATLLTVAFAATQAAAASDNAPKSFRIQIADAGLLAPPAPPLAPPPAAPPRPGALLPAPVPNPDVLPPQGAETPTARLNPALLSRQDLFQGNGFARASDLDHGMNVKDKPAAGINLSVPVK